MATKHPWQSLIGSLSESGHALHSLIMGHPASKYLNVSLIYNRIYHESQETSDNLYYSRCRAGLLTLAVLDDTARILKLVPAQVPGTESGSVLPDAALRDLIVSLGYHPESKMLQKLVIAVRSSNGIRVPKVERRKQLQETTVLKRAADIDIESTDHLFKPKPVPKEELDRNKTFNDISFNFVKGKS